MPMTGNEKVAVQRTINMLRTALEVARVAIVELPENNVTDAEIKRAAVAKIDYSLGSLLNGEG